MLRAEKSGLDMDGLLTPNSCELRTGSADWGPRHHRHLQNEVQWHLHRGWRPVAQPVEVLETAWKPRLTLRPDMRSGGSSGDCHNGLFLYPKSLSGQLPQTMWATGCGDW